MKIISYLLLALYRVWFYILVALPIVVLFPLLLISILKESWYPFFFRLARWWGTFILLGMGLRPVIEPKRHYDKDMSYLFVANHTSMTDIMLMLYVTRKPFVFVGKQELAKFPVFGYFYKKTCILVDRSDVRSRNAVFKKAEATLHRGLSVCIFPEGGVPDDPSVQLDSFKDGAFRLAIAHKIPVAPMTFHDNKARFPYRLSAKGGPGILRVTLHPVIPTGILGMADRRKLKEQTRMVILESIQNRSE